MIKKTVREERLTYQAVIGPHETERLFISHHEGKFAETVNNKTSAVCLKCANFKVQTEKTHTCQNTFKTGQRWFTDCDMMTHCPAEMHHHIYPDETPMRWDEVGRGAMSTQKPYEVNGREKYALDEVYGSVEKLEKAMTIGDFTTINEGMTRIQSAMDEIGDDKLIDLIKKVNPLLHERAEEVLTRAASYDPKEYNQYAVHNHMEDAMRYAAHSVRSDAYVKPDKRMVELFSPPDPDVPQGDLDDFGTW